MSFLFLFIEREEIEKELFKESIFDSKKGKAMSNLDIRELKKTLYGFYIVKNGRLVEILVD